MNHIICRPMEKCLPHLEIAEFRHVLQSCHHKCIESGTQSLSFCKPLWYKTSCSEKFSHFKFGKFVSTRTVAETSWRGFPWLSRCSKCHIAMSNTKSEMKGHKSHKLQWKLEENPAGRAEAATAAKRDKLHNSISVFDCFKVSCSPVFSQLVSLYNPSCASFGE